ncbi:hypothetical protein GCM10027589_13160 [Actinocorallia lasiicapitis]
MEAATIMPSAARGIRVAVDRHDGGPVDAVVGVGSWVRLGGAGLAVSVAAELGVGREGRELGAFEEDR